MTTAPKIAGVNLTSNPPHNTRIEVNFGALSILFSYGSPIAYDYLDGVKILEGLNRHQQRHANQWRRFDKQEKLPFKELALGFLSALSQESDKLTYTALSIQENAAMPDTNEPIEMFDNVDAEVDELDDEDDGDDEDDEFDDDDSDDLWDGDDDDEEDDEDEEDDDLDLDDDDEQDNPPPLQENEY